MSAPASGSLVGQVAVVTGASHGIGRGVARALSAVGAKVVVTARSTRLLEELAVEIGGIAVTMDVAAVESIREGFDEIVGRLGRIDILVNNAGLGENHPSIDVTESDWDKLMAVNAKGLFFCCQAAARPMLSRGYGRIVNMSSQAGVVGIRDHAVYCASKGAVNQLTRVLALEWSARGITVNAIAPTFVYTEGTRERLDQPDYLRAVVERIPAGRVATIDDVAGAVLYLASPGSGLVTGIVLPVDGGWTAQ
jgi:NAD(P)-dependent dehydrogenase (short-subunit alcohol dehydrogenase family)